jgi:vacuolar-type H+-ATPase subunit E/Vma4
LEKEEKAKRLSLFLQAEAEKEKRRAVWKRARQALRDFEWSEKAKLCRHSKIVIQADAQAMDSKVKATLAETGMMQKCIDSIASSPYDELRDHAQQVRNYGTKWHLRKARACFVDMEGNKAALPYSFSVVAEGLRRSWLMNPCRAGALATVDDIEVIASSSRALELELSSSRACWLQPEPEPKP